MHECKQTECAGDRDHVARGEIDGDDPTDHDHGDAGDRSCDSHQQREYCGPRSQNPGSGNGVGHNQFKGTFLFGSGNRAGA